jgi:4-hydroxybenzoate polyprenyltransferase
VFFVTFVVPHRLCAFAPLRENISVFKTIRHLLELIRFSHTIFALPFALLAAVMAWRLAAIERPALSPYDVGVKNIGATYWSNDPMVHDRYVAIGMMRINLDWLPIWNFYVRWEELAGILLCMVTARSFAMAFNRLADRQLDAANPRTAGRHLPAGILSVPQVARFASASAVGFIAATLLFLPNWLPLALSVPVLAFLASYSFAKRFTWLAHFWLGTALALSPVAAWIAIRGETVIANPLDALPAFVLGGAVLTWVAGFDIIYACQDYAADIKTKLHSVPARFGLLTIVFLAGLPLAYPFFGWIYWTGVVAVALLLVYEHLLVRPDDLSRVNAAFFNVNAVISLGLFAVGSLDLLVRGG